MKSILKSLKNTSGLLFTNKSLERKQQALYLTVIFMVAFILRLLIFFNTTIFSFSDFTIYYSGAFKIIKGEYVEVFSVKGPLFISYAGAWFIRNFGSIDFWFYTNILLSSLSILPAWGIIKNITSHSGIANLSILLISVYPTFIIQPSVFYTQVGMIFFEAAIILLLLLAYRTPSYFLAVLYLLLSSSLIVISMFFKWELLYFNYFIGISSVYLFLLKYKRQALISVLFCLLSLVFLRAALHFYEPLQTYLENGSNKFFFYGQTLYGGGEGVMLENYKGIYNKGLEEFKTLHNNEFKNEIELTNAYNNMIIKDFIVNHPGQWAGLQVKKFFRTLGVKPEGVSFKLLVSGKMPLGKFSGGAVLSLPFVFLFLCCIFLFNWSIVKKLLESAQGLFIITVFVYFLIATIFYAHYQIRYRMPLEFFFIIPAASTFIITAVSKGNTIKTAIKKHLKWKIIVFVIFLCAWAYETYDIFYLNRDRYIKNAEKYEEGIVP